RRAVYPAKLKCITADSAVSPQGIRVSRSGPSVAPPPFPSSQNWVPTPSACHSVPGAAASQPMTAKPAAITQPNSAVAAAPTAATIPPPINGSTPEGLADPPSRGTVVESSIVSSGRRDPVREDALPPVREDRLPEERKAMVLPWLPRSSGEIARTRPEQVKFAGPCPRTGRSTVEE